MLISILACSLGFQAEITSERGTFTKNPIFKMKPVLALNQLVSLFYLFVGRGGRKRRTDRRTDKPSTVTLAAHARRGLTTAFD